MNRQSNVPLNTGAAPVFSQQQTGRVPPNYRDGMIHTTVRPENSDIRTSDKRPAQRRSGHFSENTCFVSAPTCAGKWKSSFKPVDDELSQDGNSQDKSTSSSERTELYDPYDPGSSDSEPEMLRRGLNHNRSPPDQDNNLARQRLSPDRGSQEKHRWHSSFSEPGRRPLDSRDIKPETRPTESRGLSPGHGLLERRAYCSDAESHDRPGPITCDLCDVEFANGQELQEHLDSKSHWDTLEHIQQQNSYDDLAIAFLQEAMLYKSRQPCSRAIEYSALEALQENDHMTKVEMFHCASCRVFIPTSVSSVQSHITSQEHLSNAKVTRLLCYFRNQFSEKNSENVSFID
ncbi:hypothetical protein PAMP_004652 [Pampus punctatissimus]